MKPPNPMDVSCPVPREDTSRVLLAHGGGGRLMRRLIEEKFLAAFDDAELHRRHDAAVLEPGAGRIAFTTDSYVVQPLFFPGGDIGSLAVHGTVNDLAMAGARPLYLSVGFILEEGLPTETLEHVIGSMAAAARACGVRIVTGDTKVVDRGRGDGIYVNTAGVGVVEHDRTIGPAEVREGDAIVVSGDVGRHGIAVMTVRKGLEFETTVESDSAPVAEPVLALLAEGLSVRCLRDLTRGGLAAALHEIATDAGVEVLADESAIPVDPRVRGACELLGLDPVHVANEGRFLAVVPSEEASRAVEILRRHEVSSGACTVGTIRAGRGIVTMKGLLGAERILDLPAGEPLPRIC